jgi:hypothetical protein
MAEPTVQVPVSLIERAVEGLLKAPGRDAILVCGELHTLLSQPTPSAEPPRIEDMAPGTTFTVNLLGSGIDYRVTVPDFGVQYRLVDRDLWVHLRDRDPSTSRDVTPPKEEA